VHLVAEEISTEPPIIPIIIYNAALGRIIDYDVSTSQNDLSFDMIAANDVQAAISAPNTATAA